MPSESDAISSSYPQGVVDVQTFGDRLDVLVSDPKTGEAEVRELFRQNHLQATTIELAEPTLENVFVTRLRHQGAAAKFF